MDEKLLGMMCEVFKKHKPIEKIALFGSRAKGTHKKNSDVDLAVFGGEESLLFCEQLAEELSELPTLLKFDVIGYKNIKNAALLEHIDRVGIVIYEQRT